MNETNPSDNEINRLADYIAANFLAGDVDPEAAAPLPNETAVDAAIRLLGLGRRRHAYDPPAKRGELPRTLSPVEYILAAWTRGGAMPFNRPRNPTEERVHAAIMETLKVKGPGPAVQDLEITCADRVDHDRLFDVLGASGFGYCSTGIRKFDVRIPVPERLEYVTLYLGPDEEGVTAEVMYGRDEGNGIPVSYRVIADGRVLPHADVYFVGWPPKNYRR